MTMDQERYLVEYPEQQIDSLQGLIFVIKFLRQISLQLTNAKLDHFVKVKKKKMLKIVEMVPKMAVNFMI